MLHIKSAYVRNITNHSIIHIIDLLRNFMNLSSIFKGHISLDLTGYSPFQLCHIKVLSYRHQMALKSYNGGK